MRRPAALTVLAPVLFLVTCAGPLPPQPPSPSIGTDAGGPDDAGDGNDGGPQDAGTASVDGGDDDAGDDGGGYSDGDGGNDGGNDGGDDAGHDGGDDGGTDAGTSNACEVFGAPGQCIAVSACAALGDHTSYAGHCPGPATIECCIDTPDTADNPPIPAGYKLMQQYQVTPEMTTWAVSILHDPATYPMFDTVIRIFGSLTVLARVEWHPPDFQNGIVHRGVTLYVPA